MASPPQALADGSSTRRRGDGAIAGGAGERRSAPVTVWPCRSGRFRPTALSPMGRRAGSVAASTAPGRPKGRLQPWRAQRYRQRADGESLPIHGGCYRPEGVLRAHHMEGVDEHFRRLARPGAAALSGDGPPSRVSPSGGRRCRSSDGEPSAFETRASPISPCVVNGRLRHFRATSRSSALRFNGREPSRLARATGWTVSTSPSFSNRARA